MQILNEAACVSGESSRAGGDWTSDGALCGELVVSG